MKDKHITQNINNLTSLWKTASAPFDSRFKNSVFEYCEVKDSDWPNRLWFNQPIDQSSIDMAKKKLSTLSSPLTIPYFNINTKNTYELLEKNDFKLQFEQVAMFLKLEETFKISSNLTMVHISNEAQAELWAALYPRAFGYRIPKKIITSTWNDIHYFLAYYQNQPIGTAITFQTQKTIGIHGVGIIPEMRKRGFASEIMKHLINIAIGGESDFMTLQASSMGKNVYLKLGFKEQFLIKNYAL
ncbi:GNAT family N-acetyltransferase [Aquimarina algiphila]|uniref:GNAT family N-acetyltransferase n=1 Tax=Aquimarina algiphila TaxID=2047982 RepID=UPI00232FF790|nr:GNAT family N-acetyltransferase [Aquimarina algiphila]